MLRTDNISADDLIELLDYDSKTGSLTWKTRSADWFPHKRAANFWNSRYAGSTASSKTAFGYLTVSVLGKQYYAHRVCWAIYNGAWPDGYLDHINHNRADNRIENLRLASYLENNKNASKRKDNSSGVTGVCFERESGKWLVQIFHAKKNVKIGRFSNFEEAIAARKEAERLYGFHENHGLEKIT